MHRVEALPGIRNRVAVLLGICALACAGGAGGGGAGGLGLTNAFGVGARTASAAQRVKLSVHLSPERLGKGTTIEFSIQISAPGKLVPSPLRELDLQYPQKIGLLQSGLGRASCTAAALENLGKGGCPANALMGFGSALVEIQVGQEVVHEAGAISIWMGPVLNEEFQLLFYANAVTPASEYLVFGGLLEEADPPFGGSLDTHIPSIPWSPEAPPRRSRASPRASDRGTSPTTGAPVTARSPTAPKGCACRTPVRAAAFRSRALSRSWTARPPPPGRPFRAPGARHRVGSPLL